MKTNLTLAVLSLSVCTLASAEISSGGGGSGTCSAPAALDAAQLRAKIVTLTTGTVNLRADVAQVKLADASAANSEILVNTSVAEAIVSTGAAGVIDKDNLTTLSQTAATANVDVAQAISAGQLVLPAQDFILPKLNLATTSANAQLLANYLLSRSDAQIVDLMKYGLTGTCKYIRRTYLPVSLRPNIAFDDFIYNFNTAKAVEASRVNFSKQVQIIPGVAVSSGATFGCGTGHRLEVCKIPTLSVRLAMSIRQMIRTTLPNFGASDLCGLQDVVTQMQATANGANYQTAVNGGKVKFFYKSSTDKKIVCFNELGTSASAFPANLKVQLAGQWYTPLPEKVCSLFYNAAKKGDANYVMNPGALVPVPAGTTITAPPAGTGTVSADQYHLAAHAEYATALAADSKLNLTNLNLDVKQTALSTLNSIAASDGRVDVVYAQPLLTATATMPAATCGAGGGGGTGGTGGGLEFR